jgi:hypothetical protein
MTRSIGRVGMAVLVATVIGCGEPASPPPSDASPAATDPAAAEKASPTRGQAKKLIPAPLSNTRPID